MYADKHSGFKLR